jgi:hypothetical protein
MPEAHVAMQTVTGPVGIRGLLQPVLGSGARIYAPQALSLILAGCLHLVSPASVPQSTLPWRGPAGAADRNGSWEEEAER